MIGSEAGQVLELGKPYPLPLPSVANTGGAMAQFLTSSGNILQVLLPDATKEEIDLVSDGPVKAGLIIDGLLIYWVFQFGEHLVFDSPFDARLIPDEAFCTFDAHEKDVRLTMSIHLVDTQTNLIKGLRVMTLPAPLCQKFIVASKLQREREGNMQAILSKYLQYPLMSLLNKTTMYPCGV